MKSFLLFTLSLMAGCEARSDVRGCLQGWVEFTCKYPNPNGIYHSTVVVSPGGLRTRSTQMDVWETTGRVSLYHDTENKKLTVAIKQLECRDFGMHQCKFYQNHNSTPDSEEVKLEVDNDGCQRPFIQTAYKTARTTITCDHPGNRNKSSVQFLCKDTNLTCEAILAIKSSSNSNGRLSLTETHSDFRTSTSDVSSNDAGVYWCGVKSNEGGHRASLRQIQLNVKDIGSIPRSPTIGQTVQYRCSYPNSAPLKKFFCKGEDPSTCQFLVSTAQLNMDTGKFSMKAKNKKTKIQITVRKVTAADTGTYWCGAESTDKRRSNPFFRRFILTVESVTKAPLNVTITDDTPMWTKPAFLSFHVLLLVLMLSTTLFVHIRYKNPNRGAGRVKKRGEVESNL